MRRIDVTKKTLHYPDFVKRSAKESDFSTLITEDCAIFCEGELKVIYTRLPMVDSEVVSALQRIKFQTSTRVAGLTTTSRIFGYMPRVVQRADYCRSASLSQDFPKENAVICNYGRQLADLYAQEAPGMFKMHKETTEGKVRQEYIIPGTPFTSGIINKNNPLKYHYDSGNFKKVYSNMLAFKYNVEGGYLAFPEYDFALEIANNSVLIFDGQEILHGVTPIKYLSPDAYRYTIVYYSLQQMWKCLPLTEELARIRNLKTEREFKRSARSNEETLGENVR